jgi:hypothetical protein
MEESPIDGILAQATGRGGSGPVDKVYDAIEGVYGSLGMMEGESAPAKRLLFTGALAGGAAWAIKPAASFDEKGAPRPWILTTPSHPRATYFPWFMWAGIGGLVGGFFV